MGILSHEEIRELHAAAIAARLTRAALWAGIEPAFVATLPETRQPGDGILMDLDALNRAGVLADGTTPLAVWLQNALSLAGIQAQSAIFERALARVQSGASPVEHRMHGRRPGGAVNLRVVASFAVAGAVAGVTLEITKASALVFLLSVLTFVFLLIGWMVRVVLAAGKVAQATAGTNLSLAGLAVLVLTVSVGAVGAEVTARTLDRPPVWRAAQKPMPSAQPWRTAQQPIAPSARPRDAPRTRPRDAASALATADVPAVPPSDASATNHPADSVSSGATAPPSPLGATGGATCSVDPECRTDECWGGTCTSFKVQGPAGMTITGKTADMSIADDGTTVTITVPLANIDTGIGLRNNHTKRALEADKYPNVTLAVARSALKFPADGAEASADAKGAMTLHGRTKDVTFHYWAKRSGNTYTVTGRVHINVNDFDINPPTYLGITVKPDTDIDTAFQIND